MPQYLNGARKKATTIIALSAIYWVIAAGPTFAQPCYEHVLEAERANGIPHGLLLAMALVESGQAGIPQAHALSVGGRSIFADSAAAAARHFRDRRGHLRNNVYVGCLQLSLKHHGRNFRPVDRIADPEANTKYAATYLVRHYEDLGNWTKAVARYNGGSRKQQRAYVCKIWNALVNLDRKSAGVLDGSNCATRPIAVAPRTRRALSDVQLAETRP